MAPPITDITQNPGFMKFGFVKVQTSVTDPSSGKPRMRVDYIPKPGSGYDILTDEVLNTGNLKTLNDFRRTHRKELSDPKNELVRIYLDARIETAKRFEARERKAKLDAAMKKVYPKPAVDNKDGIAGFPDLKYPDYQTSSNGCWSLSYSTLLRSRGIDISQEEIRRWRPDYNENVKAEDVNPERKRLMNSDTGNSIFPNSDLLGKVLPNTAVNQLRIEPFETEQLLINGRPLNDEQKKAVGEEYKAQAKTNLQKTIMNAIQVHKSPVAVSWDGHFITVTGISPDGNTIRYEESLARKPKRSARAP